MPKFTFRSKDLRRGLALAKIVKPETNDLCLRFSKGAIQKVPDPDEDDGHIGVHDGVLTIFSHDKRRYACIRIGGDTKDVPEGFVSHEFYVTVDRTSLLDSQLGTVTFSVNEKSLGIRAVGDEVVRKASIQRRRPRSRRPPIPEVPDAPVLTELNCDEFDTLLRQVSCSAQIKETKTEEEMRVNQVHFYGEEGCAVSRTRYYGTVARMEGMTLDLSIVSSDIPSIKAFCSKSFSKGLRLAQDDAHLYLIDPVGDSVLSFSRVASKKPSLSLLDDDGFSTVIVVDQESLSKSLSWAQVAIEGTQRMTVVARRDAAGAEDGHIELIHGDEELSRVPVRFVQGDGISADFPVRFFFSISKYVDGDVALKYGHEQAGTVLSLSQHEAEGSVRSVHYLNSMVQK